MITKDHNDYLNVSTALLIHISGHKEQNYLEGINKVTDLNDTTTTYTSSEMLNIL